MRGELASHQPVDRLHQVLMDARHLDGDAAGFAVPSSGGSMAKLEASWDNQSAADFEVFSSSCAIDKLEARWDNSAE